MRIHSNEAWSIAALYGHTLASETRDLAAHIDQALNLEREECARIAEVAGSKETANIIRNRKHHNMKNQPVT